MITEITDIGDSRVSIFASLTDHELARTDDNGLFVAESPKVILTALGEGYRPKALLCEQKHIDGDAAPIIAAHPEMEVFTGRREVLSAITGYKLTRGVLCAMYRNPAPAVKEICRSAHRIALIEGVCDTTNVGSIFRSAAALGIDCILLTRDSCDPLNRRSVRVSMGAVFKIPWAFADNPVDLLKENGFVTVALALTPEAIAIDSDELRKHERIAMVLGTEGNGLKRSTIARCDYQAVIPMHNGVDSLNVGAAAAVAFWQLRTASLPH